MSGFRRQLLISALSHSVSTPLSYTIDQSGTYTTPATMIKDISQGVVNGIRAASHLYVGTLSNGTLVCKQVSDTDKTLYADGTSVTYDGTNDLFMKLPQFWWKHEALDNDGDIVKFSFTMDNPNDNTWNEWQGNTFIGSYEAKIVDSALFSTTGGTPAKTVSYDDYKAYSRARGNGYSLVTYETHQIMALLGWGYIGSLDSQTYGGVGTSTAGKTIGQCNSLGMSDTRDNSYNSTNFWGLENWWGDLYEIMDNVGISSTTVSLYDYSGSFVRTIANVYFSGSTNACVKKMIFGTYADLMIKESGGTDFTKYYSDMNRLASGTKPLARSGWGLNASGGLACLYTVVNSNTATHAYGGTRLQYKGSYQIV